VLCRIKAVFSLLALTGLLYAALASTAGAAAPNLKVVANEIRDQTTGTEFIPRGVNWPSFEYACVQGWGYSNLGANPVTAQAMVDWGINTVRLPLNQDCWLGDDSQPRNVLLGPILTPAGYRNAVAEFVADLTDAGLAVILDLHWNGQQGTVADGLRPMADSRSDDFWASVATRFKTEPAVMFDLFNEPHSRWDPANQRWAFDQSWSCWANGGCVAPDQPDTDTHLDGGTYTTVGMKTLVNVVRASGAAQPIILGGLDYANDLGGWLGAAPADDQLIAGFHNYPGKPCGVQSCWSGEIAALARKVPLLTTELGQSDCQAGFINRYMDWADKQGIGYLAWAWWDLTESHGPNGCTNFALVQDLGGTPTPGYGTAFKDHLANPLAKDPEPPPEDPDPPNPPRPKLQAAKLTIRSAVIKRGKLRARFSLNPAATGRLMVRQDMAHPRNQKRRRTTKTTVPIKRGRAQAVMPVPRAWTAKRIFVSYRGNELVRPAQKTKRLKGR
jgi:endoglucanase